MNDIKNIKISLETDTSGFLKTSCPNCDLEFKIYVEEESYQDILAWAACHELDKYGLEHNSSSNKPESVLYCPYCRHEAPMQNFYHKDHVDYAIQIVQREIVEPMLKPLLNTLNNVSKGTKNSMLAIKVSANFARTQFPLYGPEPDDQLIIRCLSCTEKFKICETWPSTVRCIRCGSLLNPI